MSTLSPEQEAEYIGGLLKGLPPRNEADLSRLLRELRDQIYRGHAEVVRDFQARWGDGRVAHLQLLGIFERDEEVESLIQKNIHEALCNWVVDSYPHLTAGIGAQIGWQKLYEDPDQLETTDKAARSWFIENCPVQIDIAAQAIDAASVDAKRRLQHGLARRVTEPDQKPALKEVFDAFKKSHGLTGKAIASRARIDRSDMYKVLRGELVGSEKARRLARVIGFGD